jgi:hypothetical protein
LFRNSTLDFYNIKTAKIKEMINVELPDVKVREKSTDIVFLLEDDSYLHLEFQTTYSRADLTRFVIYDALLYERDGRKIETYVIYSSEVTTAETNLNIGTLKFAPQAIMFSAYDGNATYTDLEKKLKTGHDLTDLDMLNLIFLPLMKTDKPKDELAEKSVTIAKSIPDETKRNTCIASIIALSSKYLDEDVQSKLLGEIKMSDMVTMLVTEAVTEALTDERIAIAKTALENGLSVEIISIITGLGISTVQELVNETDSKNEDTDNSETNS